MEQNISEKSTIETLIPTNDIPESDTNLSAKTTEQTINYDQDTITTNMLRLQESEVMKRYDVRAST